MSGKELCHEEVAVYSGADHFYSKASEVRNTGGRGLT
jgi:hypothetical protein